MSDQVSFILFSCYWLRCQIFFPFCGMRLGSTDYPLHRNEMISIIFGESSADEYFLDIVFFLAIAHFVDHWATVCYYVIEMKEEEKSGQCQQPVGQLGWNGKRQGCCLNWRRWWWYMVWHFGAVDGIPSRRLHRKRRWQKEEKEKKKTFFNPSCPARARVLFPCLWLKENKKSQVFVSEKTVSAGYPFFDGCKKKSFFLLISQDIFQEMPKLPPWFRKGQSI